jgi:hypothetical protein
MIYAGLFIIFIVLILINIKKLFDNPTSLPYLISKMGPYPKNLSQCSNEIRRLSMISTRYKEQYSPNQIQQVNIRPDIIPNTSQ